MDNSHDSNEPVAWLYKSPMPDGSVFVGASAERLQIGVGVTPDSTEQPLYTRPQSMTPLTDEQINDHRLALGYDVEDLPDPWDFKQGVRAAERAHGIGEKK